MTDTPQDKAMAKAAEAVMDEMPTDRGTTVEEAGQQFASVAVQAYLAAMEAEGFKLLRAERVKGSTPQEWRSNLSPGLRDVGDSVLAWANEGDLITAEFNHILAS